MAAAGSDAALAEFAATLKQEDIPVKLRCQICHQIAFNAWRLPCCAGDVCEACKETLPEECPVCLHSPVPKDDFKPNKKLRNTVKAFLKGKVTESANKKKKEEAAAQESAIAPASGADAAAEISAGLEDRQVSEKAGVEESENTAVKTIGNEINPESASTPTVGQEKVGETQSKDQHVAPQPQQQEQVRDDSADQIATQEAGREAEDQKPEDKGIPDETGSKESNMPVDNMNSAMSMDPSQMMNMNMMMGNMGVDPMTMMQQMQQMSAQMMAGFGGSMNMNGGMGYNPNQFGNFNGQQNSWGASDNYNSNYGGYNSGNFNQMNHQQFGRNDFQYGYRGRGRGRGRGGFYGRGGQGYYNQDFRSPAGGYGNDNSYQGHPSSHNQGFGQGGETSVQEYSMHDAVAGQAHANQPQNETGEASELAAGHPIPDASSAQTVIGKEDDDSAMQDTTTGDSQPMAIQTFMSDDSRRRYGPQAYAEQPALPAAPSEPRGVPGAPTGPRALREGLPNTGASGRGFMVAGRASTAAAASAISRRDKNESDIRSNQDEEERTVHSKPSSVPHDRPRSRSQSRSRSHPRSRPRSRSRTHSKSRSRSRSPDHSSRHKSRRDRSRNRDHDSVEESKSNRRDERRHRRHKYDDEYTDEESGRGPSRRSRRHRHRDRSRDKDRKIKDRERENERYRHREDDRSDESGSRKRRHRDRDEDDYDRHDRKRSRRERSRSNSRDPDDRGSRYKQRDSKPSTPVTASAPNPLSSSDAAASRRASLVAIAERRHHSRAQTHASTSGPPLNAPSGPSSSSKSIPTGPRNQQRESRRERRRRKESQSGGRYEDEISMTDANKKTAQQPKVEKDPITLEREQRNRERLMKEMQRRAIAGDGGGSGGGASGKSSHKQRRSSYRYEDDDGGGGGGGSGSGLGGDDDRQREGEREREDARWG